MELGISLEAAKSAKGSKKTRIEGRKESLRSNSAFVEKLRRDESARQAKRGRRSERQRRADARERCVTLALEGLKKRNGSSGIPEFLVTLNMVQCHSAILS